MGVLNRFKEIMSANVNDFLDKFEDPVKMAEQKRRELRESLAELQEETSAVMTATKQAQEFADNIKSQMDHCADLAKKALQNNDEASARKCIEQKQTLQTRYDEACKKLEIAQKNSDRMRQLHDKLVSDITICDQKCAEVKQTEALAKAQERANKIMSNVSDASKLNSSIDRMQDKAQERLDKAMAMAELMEGTPSEMDEIEKKYGGATSSSVEDELSAMKAELGL